MDIVRVAVAIVYGACAWTVTTITPIPVLVGIANYSLGLLGPIDKQIAGLSVGTICVICALVRAISPVSDGAVVCGTTVITVMQLVAGYVVPAPPPPAITARRPVGTRPRLFSDDEDEDEATCEAGYEEGEVHLVGDDETAPKAAWHHGVKSRRPGRDPQPHVQEHSTLGRQGRRDCVHEQEEEDHP